MDDLPIKYQKVRENAKVPTKGSEGAACYDIYAIAPAWLNPDGRVTIIPTGLIFEVPGGWEMEIRPRSGLATKSVTIANSPGTLDSDYRGELMILLQNSGRFFHQINIGDRIAQIKFNRVHPVEFVESETLGETQRGVAGFGSTGD